MEKRYHIGQLSRYLNDELEREFNADRLYEVIEKFCEEFGE